MSYEYTFPFKRLASDLAGIVKSTALSALGGNKAARNRRARRQEEERQRREEEEERQQLLAAQQLPPHLVKVEMRRLDLYQIYLLRMQDRTPNGIPFEKIRGFSQYYSDPAYMQIKPPWFMQDFITDIQYEPLIFAIFTSILLSCDKTHDFTRDRIRTELKKNAYYTDTPTDKKLTNNLVKILEHLRDVSIDQVWEVCVAAVNASEIPNLSPHELLGHCMCMINLELRASNCTYYLTVDPDPGKYAVSILGKIFSGDNFAKNAAFAISRLLGITMVDHGQLISVSTSKNIVNELSPIQLYVAQWTVAYVKIDATSASINHVEDFIRIRDPTTAREQVLLLDSASANDPAETGALEKIFTKFNHTHYKFYNQEIHAFVRIGTTNVNILTATLTPVGGEMVGNTPITPGQIPNIKLRVNSFLGYQMIYHEMEPKTNSLGSVITKLLDRWNSYGGDHNLNPANLLDFKDMARKYTMEKTLGDFLQVLSYAASEKPKVFITVDKITAVFAGILGSTVILEGGSMASENFRRLFVTSQYADGKLTSLMDLCVISTGSSEFGKINNISKRIKFMTDSELKNKLKFVGIKITKNVRGKRKYLTRKELENKALLFNKLQNTAKIMKIKIMYKSRNGIYKYKTYKRLQKEINLKNKKSNHKSNKKNKSKNRSNFG